eukprot:gene14455-biopygen2078
MGTGGWWPSSSTTVSAERFLKPWRPVGGETVEVGQYKEENRVSWDSGRGITYKICDLRISEIGGLRGKAPHGISSFAPRSEPPRARSVRANATDGSSLPGVFMKRFSK